jgi:hypothetical protein
VKENKRDAATVAGVGAVACAACCAGPILGVVASLGLGAVAGTLAVGALGLAVAAAVAFVVLRRRRAASGSCPAPEMETMVALGRTHHAVGPASGR